MRVAYQAASVGQIWHKKEKCPLLEDVSHSGLWSNVTREWCPWSVIRRTCHAADIGQMWQKNDAPHRRTLSHGPNCVPNWRTLSRSVLQQIVVQIVPLVGGLCHAVDFDQMWSKMCLLLEDFVSLQTSTKCGPNMCSLTEHYVLLRI